MLQMEVLAGVIQKLRIIQNEVGMFPSTIRSNIMWTIEFWAFMLFVVSVIWVIGELFDIN